MIEQRVYKKKRPRSSRGSAGRPTNAMIEGHARRVAALCFVCGDPVETCYDHKPERKVCSVGKRPSREGYKRAEGGNNAENRKRDHEDHGLFDA